MAMRGVILQPKRTLGHKGYKKEWNEKESKGNYPTDQLLCCLDAPINRIYILLYITYLYVLESFLGSNRCKITLEECNLE